MNHPDRIVAGLHLRWDGVRQRPHHLLSRFAKHVPVLVVEEPFAAREDRDEVLVHGNLTVVRPLRRTIVDPFGADAATLATVRGWAGSDRVLTWLTTPMMSALADAVPGPLAFDCMDELAAFDFAPPSMRERERALLERADIVFAGGRSLFTVRHDAYGEKVKLYPSGVEYDVFSQAGANALHPLVAELRALRAPLFGYTGVIDERIDVGILERFADEARANVLMVGPLAKIDPSLLPRNPCMHFTGQMPYEDLPSIVAGFDVAIMPFARNESTRYISPTKTLEYLAARVPVVSTPVTDVVSDFRGIVAIAEGASEFTAACHYARAGDPAALDRGAALARGRTWDAIVAGMWQDLTSLPSAPQSLPAAKGAN